ncbi:RVT_1 domain-containing protein, partial [Cephalotus follicularis]
MQDFNNTVRTAELEDLKSTGLTYTWSNMRMGSATISKKLDRAMGNWEWFQSFGYAYAHTHASGISDHSPITVQLMQQTHTSGRPFKFLNFWAEHPQFLDIVRQEWTKSYTGPLLRRIQLKLKKLKGRLKSLSTRPDSITEALRRRLREVQLQIDGNPEDVELKQQEIKLRNELAISARKEEAFFKQKSRIHWLKEGDFNTAFFHRAVKLRQSKNHITHIQNDLGIWLDLEEDIAQEGIRYFKNLFDKQGSNTQQLLSYPKRILPEHSTSLGSPITRYEVEKAFASINPNKAPGPDGYNGCFFVKAWPIIGEDCIEAVMEFFVTCSLPQDVNNTILALIPKGSNPARYADFRPISCCNYLYKVIAKILANRIKPWLQHLIDPAQSAFIEGRHIKDNILLSQELLKGYHLNRGAPRCALKVDLHKAYDSMDWSFILSMLKLIGCPDIFISWVSQCITTPKFSIAVNGTLHGFFSSGRGLRQGDPLSPYLFVIGMDYLSYLLKPEQANGAFRFHPKCQRLNLNHLCYADDLLIFSASDLKSIGFIRDALEHFKAASGLEVGTAKSSIFFCNTNNRTRQQILRMTLFREDTLPVKYLGLPLITSRLSKHDCAPLMEKIWARTKSWTSKYLSYAGRLLLIKS